MIAVIPADAVAGVLGVVVVVVLVLGREMIRLRERVARIETREERR